MIVAASSRQAPQTCQVSENLAGLARDRTIHAAKPARQGCRGYAVTRVERRQDAAASLPAPPRAAVKTCQVSEDLAGMARDRTIHAAKPARQGCRGYAVTRVERRQDAAASLPAPPRAAVKTSQVSENLAGLARDRTIHAAKPARLRHTAAACCRVYAMPTFPETSEFPGKLQSRLLRAPR